MKNSDLKKYRNIGIMAHIDAGKTTVTERVLFYTGVSHKIGEVHEGAATMDFMEQERERGITIQSAATTCSWGDHTINIIDTPGHVDFTIEVGRSLRVLDGAVAVFCGVGRVQPQSETVWHQATHYGVPRIAFVNKLDRVGGNYFSVVADMNLKLRANALAMQIPLGESENFEGVIDVLTRRMAYFPAVDNGSIVEWRPLTEEYVDQVNKAYDAIVERACDFDDDLAAAYLAGEEVSVDAVKKALRVGVLQQKVTPVFCGTAFKNKGVQLLLDAVVDYLPSPLDRPAIKGTVPDTGAETDRPSDVDGSFAALAFKITIDPFIGSLTFTRIYSGSLESGSYVFNSTTGKRERVSRLLRLHANKREEIKVAYAGDIVGVVGLKDVTTGDTLCDEKNPVLLESIVVPLAVVTAAVEPKTKADYEKMTLALKKLAQEDPSFKFSFDPETNQTIIAGMGELHLEIKVDILRRDHKVEVVQGKPQVAYKETIRKAVKAEGKFIRQSGGRGQYGHVMLELEPLERGSGFVFESKVVGGTIPKEYIPAIEKGLKEAIGAGVIGGYPVDDLKAIVYDGSYHDVDSSELAFKIAASMALKDGMNKASPVILEPVMKVEVTTPENFMGDVMGDLSSRRGRVMGADERFGVQVVLAEVPLAEMFGYTTSLRSMTQGRASASMEFCEYREVPQAVQDAIASKKS
ncbi:elongation factor G [Candidatus Dependentiae bacterium]|nr:elongation factor G [Candidatus Dependentiae bacterium]